MRRKIHMLAIVRFSFGHLSLISDTTILMEMTYKPNNGTFKGGIVAVQTFQPFSHTNDIEGQEVSDGGDADLLDYLVEEEKGCLYRRASPCHLGPVQLIPFSCIETADPIRAHATAPPQPLVSGSDKKPFIRKQQRPLTK
jgi:hypothetical protein